jgi:GNAT superfamily N-acetyltransferase
MLTELQLQDIKILQELCELEGYRLKLNWDMLESRNPTEKNDYLHYEQGKLVAFLGLYGLGNKVELCGMVHPDYRRKGIFRSLYRDAFNQCRERGFREMLLNMPGESRSGKGFIQYSGANLHSIEYQMKCTRTMPFNDYSQASVYGNQHRRIGHLSCKWMWIALVCGSGCHGSTEPRGWNIPRHL